VKKVVLVIAALMLVVSGVAAVSAYEAHTVNVKAHVENAIQVSITEGEGAAHFGTVFPEEWHKIHADVGLSTSALAELNADRLTSVEVTVYKEWKPVPDDEVVLAAYKVIDGKKYYPWLGDCLWVGTGVDDWPNDTLGVPGFVEEGDAAHPAGDLVWVGPEPAAGKMAEPTGLVITLAGAVTTVQVGIGFDVPVFEGFYNQYTDVDPKPSKRNDPTVIILKTDTLRYFPDGENLAGDPAKLGVDLKFQVTNIKRQ
jgi:hypothetical protein